MTICRSLTVAAALSAGLAFFAPASALTYTPMGGGDRIMNANLQHYHVPNADVHFVETLFVEEDDTVGGAEAECLGF